MKPPPPPPPNTQKKTDKKKQKHLGCTLRPVKAFCVLTMNSTALLANIEIKPIWLSN